MTSNAAMLKVEFRTVAALPRGYSITLVPGSDPSQPGFVAGSEGDAELLFFGPPSYHAEVIARAPGGFISLASFTSGGKRFVVAATMFKPGFDAADSALWLYPLDEGECPAPSLIAVLPFTHRVAVQRIGGRDCVLASTLCAAKAHKEDWTQPGGIHLAAAPADLRQPWTIRQIVGGLNKNHGFDFARLGREQRPGYLVSAREGLFFLPIPANPNGPWQTEQLDAAEHSDAFAFDWDGDGEPEIFSISPFHGHILSRHKKIAGCWKRSVIHDDLAMGHIVWAGNFLGRPGLLAGSRRERRELRLYRPAAHGGVDLNYAVIDEGIGPSQIAVGPSRPGRETLFVAAHGQNEVRMYHVSNPP